MRTLAMGLALFVMGCTAQIPDGRIGCGDPMHTCPAGYYCWRGMSPPSCHRMPEPNEGGVPDAGVDASIDTGGQGPGPFQPCAPGDGCRSGLTCFEHSYCAPPCSGGTCPVEGICFDGFCLEECAIPAPGSSDTCPTGSICALGLWDGTTPSSACAPEAIISPSSHGQSCSSDAECMPPETCGHGACLRPCLEMGPCGAQASCAPLPEPDTERACLDECPTGTCDPAFTCSTGSPRNCIPNGWPPPP